MHIISTNSPLLQRTMSRDKRAFLRRLCFVPIAVCLCYLLGWHWLRVLTADLTIRLTVLAGFEWTRVGPDLVMFRGHLFQFAIACTLVDAWCGAIPLTWKVKSTITSNCRYLGGLAVFMFALNISRLTLVNIIFSAGLPWHLVHDSFSAIIYLVVWSLILRRGAWRESSTVTGTEKKNAGLLLPRLDPSPKISAGEVH